MPEAETPTDATTTKGCRSRACLRRGHQTSVAVAAGGGRGMGAPGPRSQQAGGEGLALTSASHAPAGVLTSGSPKDKHPAWPARCSDVGFPLTSQGGTTAGAEESCPSQAFPGHSKKTERPSLPADLGLGIFPKSASEPRPCTRPISLHGDHEGTHSAY